MRILVFIRDMIGVIGVLAALYGWSGVLDRQPPTRGPATALVLAKR
jgi:hypothetical protein